MLNELQINTVDMLEHSMAEVIPNNIKEKASAIVFERTRDRKEFDVVMDLSPQDHGKLNLVKSLTEEDEKRRKAVILEMREKYKNDAKAQLEIDKYDQYGTRPEAKEYHNLLNKVIEAASSGRNEETQSLLQKIKNLGYKK